MRIIKRLVNLIPIKSLRRKLRDRLLLKNNKWERKIIKKAKSYGGEIYVGGESSINNNTYLGTKVCFNGMRIMGKGKVTIGNYFHSGVECLIIAQNLIMTMENTFRILLMIIIIKILRLETAFGLALEL
ncbi:MAG: hypothetical protein R3Y43_08195 [Alphaproteobacteria bacterium]